MLKRCNVVMVAGNEGGQTNMKNINDLLQETKDAQDGLGNLDDAVQKSDDQLDEKPIERHQQVAPVKTEEKLQEKIEELEQKEIEQELKNKAQSLGAGYVNFKGAPVATESLEHIPLDEVKDKKVLCFYYAEHKVAKLATIKIGSEEIESIRQEYAEKLKVPVEMFITSAESFATVVERYEKVPKIKEAPRGVEINSADLDRFSDRLTSLDNIAGLIKEVSITELVALIIAAGLKTEASDIHIEAEADGIKLRYRIDGVLHTADVLEKNIWQKLVSRLKLLSNLKLNISDKPQDGRFSIFLKNDKVDVRVSCLPTNYGESVVMRLLMSKATKISFEELGLSDQSLNLLVRQIKRPNGMLITTGPTGSGKTTMLYAILNKLNQPETKIITIEDPIEYELTGVNQSQVTRDYTFAKGLRSIVRQDPDIVMVGEMRDLETVDIALNAALTGHLVLSTLHTNNAPGAIPRFLAMGAKPYLLAPALNLIMAQRLVRRLCEKCKKEVELDGETINKIEKILNEIRSGVKTIKSIKTIKFYGPAGCDACNQIGYKGRIGIFEMFEMNKEIEQIILSNQVSEYRIREIAEKNGMMDMAQDGLLKATQGITSVEEVFRVVE